MGTPEERRARWQRSVDHKALHRLRVDHDPVFVAWIEEWIAGDVSINEVQQRYAALLLSRDKSVIANDDIGVIALMDEIRQDFPGAGDVKVQRAVERSKTTRAINAAWQNDE